MVMSLIMYCECDFQ